MFNYFSPVSPVKRSGKHSEGNPPLLQLFFPFVLYFTYSNLLFLNTSDKPYPFGTFTWVTEVIKWESIYSSKIPSPLNINIGLWYSLPTMVKFRIAILGKLATCPRPCQCPDISIWKVHSIALRMKHKLRRSESGTMRIIPNSPSIILTYEI